MPNKTKRFVTIPIRNAGVPQTAWRREVLLQRKLERKENFRLTAIMQHSGSRD
jgi:hypothetical protein